MCGRVIQSGGPLRYAIVDGLNVRDSRVHNYPPRWNAAPAERAVNAAADLCEAGPMLMKPYAPRIVLGHIKRLLAGRGREGGS